MNKSSNLKSKNNQEFPKANIMKKEFVTRYKGNPILTKDDIGYEVETVHKVNHDGRDYIGTRYKSDSA